MPAEDIPTFFRVGLIAPPKFDRPDLGRLVWRRLFPLLGNRWLAKEKVTLVGVCGEPVTAAVAERFEGQGWTHYTHVRTWDRPWRESWRIAWAQVATSSEAVVLVHGGEPGAELLAVADWCRWIGVPTRMIAVPPEAEGVAQ